MLRRLWGGDSWRTEQRLKEFLSCFSCGGYTRASVEHKCLELSNACIIHVMHMLTQTCCTPFPAIPRAVLTRAGTPCPALLLGEREQCSQQNNLKGSQTRKQHVAGRPAVAPPQKHFQLHFNLKRNASFNVQLDKSLGLRLFLSCCSPPSAMRRHFLKYLLDDVHTCRVKPLVF